MTLLILTLRQRAESHPATCDAATRHIPRHQPIPHFLHPSHRPTKFTCTTAIALPLTSLRMSCLDAIRRAVLTSFHVPALRLPLRVQTRYHYRRMISVMSAVALGCYTRIVRASPCPGRWPEGCRCEDRFPICTCGGERAAWVPADYARRIFFRHKRVARGAADTVQHEP